MYVPQLAYRFQVRTHVHFLGGQCRVSTEGHFHLVLLFNNNIILDFFFKGGHFYLVDQVLLVRPSVLLMLLLCLLCLLYHLAIMNNTIGLTLSIKALYKVYTNTTASNGMYSLYVQ